MIVTPRTGLPCDHCSAAYVAYVGNASVLVIEEGGYTTAYCADHAAARLGFDRFLGHVQQFSRAGAADAKADGISRAIKGLHPFWEGFAVAQVRPRLLEVSRFTPDDVRKWVALTPRHHNHWAALLMKHQGQLWDRTDEPYISKNVDGHGNKVYWWASRLYRAPSHQVEQEREQRSA
jgi:hypothetical protein